MAHTVTVRPSGSTFTVNDGETVLAAALRSGIGLPYGCKNGACGTCKGKLLEGQLNYAAHSTTALSPADEAKGLALFCCSFPQTDLVIEQRVLTGFGDIPVRRMPARIAKIDRPAPDVAIVSVQLPAAERLQFRAGQYLDFLMRDQSRRSYSIATPPHHEGPIELHVRHMPGGIFTDNLFGAGPQPVKERDIVRVEGPLGTFFVREDSSRPIILLASGTGFAPIKAIAEHIFHRAINVGRDDQPARPVTLYWGARTLRDLYMHELPQQWAREHSNFTYIPVLSEATPEDRWEGRTGFVHRAVMDDFSSLAAHQVYACGAPVMVDAARRDFIAERGLPEDEFYADAFTSAADLV